jgi:hypothetical protein
VEAKARLETVYQDRVFDGLLDRPDVAQDSGAMMDRFGKVWSLLGLFECSCGCADHAQNFHVKTKKASSS